MEKAKREDIRPHGGQQEDIRPQKANLKGKWEDIRSHGGQQRKKERKEFGWHQEEWQGLKPKDTSRWKKSMKALCTRVHREDIDKTN